MRVWIILLTILMGWTSIASAQSSQQSAGDSERRDVTKWLDDEPPPTSQTEEPSPEQQYQLNYGASEMDTESEMTEESRDGEGVGRDNLEPADDVEAPEEPPSWFLGLSGRLLWVPSFIQEIFLEEAIDVLTPGFLLVATKRTEGGLNIVFGAGYTSYAFEGPFRAKGDANHPENTEYLDSTMGMVHGTASLLWDTEISEMFAFEYGFGIDLGVVTGSLKRTEAYYENGEWYPCRARFDPPYYSGVMSSDGTRELLYCEDTISGADTDPYNEDGEHYGVYEDRVPPVMAIPSIPHLALRFMPDEKVAIKLEFSYGIIEFLWALSVHYGFN